MTSLQANTPHIENPAVHASVEQGPASRLRTAIGGILIVLAITAAVVGGGWGLISSVIAGPATPAQIGEPVEVSGGQFQVDRVIPESMAPMQMDKFAKSGMFMSGMVMDMTPEGKKRFTLEISLSGSNGVLRFSEKDFRVNGEGMKKTPPLRGQLGSGRMSSGQATSGILTFQVPKEAEKLVLTFRDSRPIVLDLKSSENPNKSHGGH